MNILKWPVCRTPLSPANLLPHTNAHISVQFENINCLARFSSSDSELSAEAQKSLISRWAFSFSQNWNTLSLMYIYMHTHAGEREVNSFHSLSVRVQDYAFKYVRAIIRHGEEIRQQAFSTSCIIKLLTCYQLCCSSHACLWYIDTLPLQLQLCAYHTPYLYRQLVKSRM